jgi:hypothetical protein
VYIAHNSIALRHHCRLPTLLGGAQCVLNAISFGDIHYGSDDAYDPTGFVVHRLRNRFDVGGGAVSSDDSIVEWSRLARRYALLEFPEDAGQIVRVDVAETLHEVRRRRFAREAKYSVTLDGACRTAADRIDDPVTGFGETLRVVEHPLGLRELIS